MAKPPLIFTFYIAAPIEKVWNGFVSKEANQTIFMGADFEIDLRPGGAMTWSGPGKDGQRTRYVTGEVLGLEAPTRLEYRFGIMSGRQIGIHRTSDRTIQFFGQHQVVRQGHGLPVTIDALVAIEA